jgi:SEC-C motif-containing protein
MAIADGGSAPCPCGSDRKLSVCCGPFLGGAARAATAEQLMRSRYSAYVLGNEEYLLDTWHISTRPERLGLAESPAVRWLSLRVIRAEAGGPHDMEGLVDFIARYKPAGRANQLHEISRFRRENGRWFYVEGVEPVGAGHGSMPGKPGGNLSSSGG